MPKAWIARFGRTVTGQVLDAVEARLAGPRTPGAQAALAGQALPSWNGGSGTGAASDNGPDSNAPERTSLAGAGDRGAAEALRGWMAHAGAERSGGTFAEDPGSVSGAGGRAALQSRALTGRDFLTGTSFALTAEAGAGGGHASLWGRGAIAGFDGREGDLTLDGEVTTGSSAPTGPPSAGPRALRSAIRAAPAATARADRARARSAAAGSRRC